MQQLGMCKTSYFQNQLAVQAIEKTDFNFKLSNCSIHWMQPKPLLNILMNQSQGTPCPQREHGAI